MERKGFFRFLVCIMALVICFSFTACDTTPEEGKFVRDDSKSQIKVTVWDGGYRKNWADNWAKAFEQKYAETSFETGKKGVQVEVLFSSANTGIFNVGTRDEDIIFSEQSKYYEFIKTNELFNITEWVTSPLTEFGETRSIADKLSLENQMYYGQDLENPQYYSVPWYMAVTAINYDIDLFNDNGLYFSPEGELGCTLEDVRSNGPDGIANTDDDGLPATFEEFFTLCDFMCDNGIIPIIWSGKNQQYMTYIYNSIVADIEGYDNMNMNYQLTGTATDLISSISGSSVTFDSQSTSISMENGYETRRQKGYYYAYEFMRRLLTTQADGDYKYYDYDGSCNNANLSHTGAQQQFLMSCETENPIAMFVDGTWWYNEADRVFSSMSSVGKGKNDRRFGILPIPKIDSNSLGGQTTVMAWPTTVLVNKKISGAREELIRTFFRFIHTDEALRSYIKDSSGLRPFDVELTQEQLSALPYYTQNQYKLYQNGCVVMPYATNKIMKNYADSLNISVTLHTNVNGTDYKNVTTAIWAGVSSKDFFYGLNKYVSDNWSSYYNN